MIEPIAILKDGHAVRAMVRARAHGVGVTLTVVSHVVARLSLLNKKLNGILQLVFTWGHSIQGKMRYLRLYLSLLSFMLAVAGQSQTPSARPRSRSRPDESATLAFGCAPELNFNQSREKSWLELNEHQSRHHLTLPRKTRPHLLCGSKIVRIARQELRQVSR